MNAHPEKNPRRAVVRGVPATYARCIRPPGERVPVDVARARDLFSAYCAALESLGIELIRVDPDDRYPDCCFVEDTAVVVDGAAVFCAMGAPSRRGESAAVADVLRELERIELAPPATMDGGDVICDGSTIYVGLTGRTNEAAAGRMADALAPRGMSVVPVAVTGALHLKSVCTRLAPGTFLVRESFSGAGAFGDIRVVPVPDNEGYAANCLAVGDVVIVSAGYPETRARIEDRGLSTIALEMSEFRKGGGSLTCLSILL